MIIILNPVNEFIIKLNLFSIGIRSDSLDYCLSDNYTVGEPYMNQEL
ncbi:hypothetical protein GCM10025777_03350 [Membranihabitans marinus]